MRKCPKGVICISTSSMIVCIICITIFISILLYKHRTVYINNNVDVGVSDDDVHNTQRSNDNYPTYASGWVPNFPYTNVPRNVLLDPYIPPVKDDRFLVMDPLVPINIATNISAVNASFRQVGMLTPLHGSSENKLLPLMGRPLITRRSLWNYYAISNQHNNIKLPIIVNGRKGLNENGVNELFSDDTVFVDGYGKNGYRVTMYETDTIKYLPII